MLPNGRTSRIPPPTMTKSLLLSNTKKTAIKQDENAIPPSSAKRGTKRTASSISVANPVSKRRVSIAVANGPRSELGLVASSRPKLGSRSRVSLAINPSKMNTSLDSTRSKMSSEPKISRPKIITRSRPSIAPARSKLDTGIANQSRKSISSRNSIQAPVRKTFVPKFNVLKEESEPKEDEQCVKLSAEIATLQGQKDDLAKLNKDLTLNLREESDKLSAVLVEKDLNAEHLRQTKSELSKLKEDYTQARCDFQDRAHSLEAHKAKLESKIEAFVSEREKILSLNSNLERSLSIETEKNRNTKHKLENTERLLMKTTSELSVASEELSKVSADLDASKKELIETNFTLKNTSIALEQSRSQTAHEKALLEVARTKISILEEEARIHERERRILHNTIQELKGNIRVFARIRPLLLAEHRSKDTTSINDFDYASENGLTIVIPPNDPEHRKLTLLGPARDTVVGDKGDSKTWDFQFDGVFGPERTQKDVFEDISQLVQSVLDGYKVCLFAYGQTGSGKTYTMEGGEGDLNRGMIPRAVDQIFATMGFMKSVGWVFDAYATHLEVYNETLRDLLADDVLGSMKHLDIRHTKDGHTNVVGITKHPLKSAEQVEALLQKASLARATSATQCNEHSSRSHSVFQLHIYGKLTGGSEERRGCLTMVDLAGSERVVKSGAKGSVLKETQAINKSLTTLGRVILALANNEPHVPFRESKLTYLLQQSLGGNSKCLMLVNLSPAPQHQGETLCSLRFAQMVNHCEIGTAKTNNKREA